MLQGCIPFSKPWSTPGVAEQGQSPTCFLTSNLLLHLLGKSILAGESDPAQGQSRKVVTLPISQVKTHETENLNDIPKATLRDQGSEMAISSHCSPHKISAFHVSLCSCTSGCSPQEDSLQPESKHCWGFARIYCSTLFRTGPRSSKQQVLKFKNLF